MSKQIENAPKGTSVWEHLPTETMTENLWLYYPIPPITSEPSEQLRAQGYAPLDGADASLLALVLSGNLADLKLTKGLGLNMGILWGKQQLIERARRRLILLAFRLPMKLFAELPPDARRFIIGESNPPPQLGTCALVLTPDGKHSRSYTVVDDLDQAAQDLSISMGEALTELTGPAGWHPYHPLMGEMLQLGIKYVHHRESSRLEARRKASASPNVWATVNQEQRYLDDIRNYVEEKKQHIEQEDAASRARWQEVQSMAQRLLEQYWRAHCEATQTEHPKPINIWTLKNGAAALTLMTMVQAGIHASINNNDKWEKNAHMITDGKYEGLKVGRYIHKTENTNSEIWWQPPETQRPVEKKKPAPEAEQLEEKKPVDLELVSQEVLRQQARLDDMECDLSNLLPAYLLASGQQEVYISREQIAKDLDYAPKRNQGGYGDGYRSKEELQRIFDAFERLAGLRIKTSQTIKKKRGQKPALVTFEEPYLTITGWEYQEPLAGFGPRQFLGWRYQITWLEQFTGNTEAGKQLGILLKKSFQFSQKQRWEKRLARYFTIQLNVAPHHGQAGIRRFIRKVLEECGLTPTERDKARPGEYADQFKKAMDNLKAVGIIGDWIPKLDRHSKDFPTRDWLNLWLDSTIYVTPAPIALEAGYQKMIDARKPRTTSEET